MTNELILTSLIRATHYRACANRDELILALRAELMLDTEHTPTDADLIAAIDRDIRDALHNSNLDFFIPIDLLDALTDDAFDSLSDFIRDHLDAAMILKLFPPMPLTTPSDDAMIMP